MSPESLFNSQVIDPDRNMKEFKEIKRNMFMIIRYIQNTNLTQP